MNKKVENLLATLGAMTAEDFAGMTEADGDALCDKFNDVVGTMFLAGVFGEEAQREAIKDKQRREEPEEPQRPLSDKDTPF
jgi:hypothetical protein